MWRAAAGARGERGFRRALRSAPGDAVRGVIAAIADGVSSGGAAEAAQTSVLALLADFFATPPTWETSVALDRLMKAQNDWLVALNRQREGARRLDRADHAVGAGAAGQGWTVAHVGDTRIWRIAGGEIQQLTQDHAYAQPDQRNRLTRAVGLDDLLHVDYLQGEARIGDRFVLTSDGVHGVLRPAPPRRTGGAGQRGRSGRGAVGRCGAGSRQQDNVTALVLRVQGWTRDALRRDGAHPPPPLPRLRVGETIDGFAITALVADTGVHRIYQARDVPAARWLPQDAARSRAADAEERAPLAHEAGWRSASPRRTHAASCAHHAPGRERALHGVRLACGQTLEQMFEPRGAAFSVAEIVQGAREIAAALGRLHRQGVIHRDIKPANLHLGDDGQWRVLDLGVALSGREGQAARELHAGTPSYMNPEQWQGAAPDAGADLSRSASRSTAGSPAACPTARSSPYRAARYRRDLTPPSRSRPDVPIWLDHLVLKAIALDARARFETAEEMLLALERGASRPVGAAATPLLGATGRAVEDRAGRLAALQRPADLLAGVPAH